MGNENEVKDIIKRSKEIFLPDEIHPDEAPQSYSLNEEFAKSRRYRNIQFGLKVMLFLVITVVTAFFASQFIEQFRSKQVFEITEFEDLRLKDLLDSASTYHARLNAVRDSIDRLRFQMQEAVLIQKNASAAERELLLAKHLSREETREEMKKISDKEGSRILAIQASYQKRIDAKGAEISELMSKIKESEKNMQVNVQKAQTIMGNYQQLHDLRMNKQKRFYESEIRKQKLYYERLISSLILKYNPVFKSPRIAEILSAGGDSRDLPKLQAYSETLARERVFSKDDFENLRKNFQSYVTLMDTMLLVPYENSVPPTLNKIDYLTRKMTNDYEKMWSSLVVVINRKNSIIGNYLYAFDYLGSINPESGFIVDPRDRNFVRVQLTKVHSVQSGDMGLVFRDDDEYIGKVEFVVRDHDLTARVIDLAHNKTIRPFDKILIQYKKEQP